MFHFLAILLVLSAFSHAHLYENKKLCPLLQVKYDYLTDLFSKNNFTLIHPNIESLYSMLYQKNDTYIDYRQLNRADNNEHERDILKYNIAVSYYLLGNYRASAEFYVNLYDPIKFMRTELGARKEIMHEMENLMKELGRRKKLSFYSGYGNDL